MLLAEFPEQYHTNIIRLAFAAIKISTINSIHSQAHARGIWGHLTALTSHDVIVAEFPEVPHKTVTLDNHPNNVILRWLGGRNVVMEL